jgi:Holliday junction resolvase RusA-like endonuclease
MELAEMPAIRKSDNTNSTYDEDLQSDNVKTENLSNESTVKNKKIIKDGDISIKTNDIYASKKGIDNLLKKLNAYYESEKLQNDDQTISYYLKIRVPSDNFEKLIISIENGKDEIISKSIQAKDVTEEYIDIESRLTNKREYLKRYKELLSKASTVKDIIAIEENIRILQEEIESKEGRLKYLNDQVLFSTLDINLYKEKEFVYKPQPQDKFSERVKKSLSNGWKSVVEFVLWTITIWPYIILLLFAFFVIKRIIKKRKSKQSL